MRCALRACSDRPLNYILFRLLGAGLITENDAMLKLVVMEHALAETIFVRGAFALVPTLSFACRTRGWSSLPCHDIKGRLPCATLLVLPLYVFIFSLRHLDPGPAVTRVFLAHLSPRRWAPCR